MHKKDVPQDSGVLENNQMVNYAVDGDGNYCLAATTGWEPVNAANRMAWEEIREQLFQVRQQVESGKLSSLAYYMTRAQMDAPLLASYAGLARWRVRRHLRPAIFAKLGSEQLQRYAELFGVFVEQLVRLPDNDELPVAEYPNPEDNK
ncbi:MAG: hypothetical protein B6I36_02130 [Desulfobacteraceae bacterium 4572_35.1]|nr:MAG: hypothetical protein B6I36_02130 [Desulfobacteraceae bacterium 4572_35.1]